MLSSTNPLTLITFSLSMSSSFNTSYCLWIEIIVSKMPIESERMAKSNEIVEIEWGCDAKIDVNISYKEG